MRTMKPKLNERQLQVLAYIRQYMRDKGYAPSIRDLYVDLNMRSAATLRKDLDRLAEAGFIGRDRRIARGIWLLPDPAGEPPGQAAHLAEATGYLDAIAATWQELRPEINQADSLFVLVSTQNMDRLVALAREFVGDRNRRSAQAV